MDSVLGCRPMDELLSTVQQYISTETLVTLCWVIDRHPVHPCPTPDRLFRHPCATPLDGGSSPRTTGAGPPGQERGGRHLSVCRLLDAVPARPGHSHNVDRGDDAGLSWQAQVRSKNDRTACCPEHHQQHASEVRKAAAHDRARSLARTEMKGLGTTISHGLTPLTSPESPALSFPQDNFNSRQHP
jgi:hypothetical protein